MALAQSDNAPLAAMGKDQVLGIQFHPEVAHTPQGKEILSNFLFNVARIEPNWSPASFIESAIDAIRAQVGEGRVLCGLSGGVDFGVGGCARSPGNRRQADVSVRGQRPVLRLNEAEEVVETFGRHMHMNLVAVDASELFLAALEGVSVRAMVTALRE